MATIQEVKVLCAPRRGEALAYARVFSLGWNLKGLLRIAKVTEGSGNQMAKQGDDEQKAGS